MSLRLGEKSCQWQEAEQPVPRNTTIAVYSGCPLTTGSRQHALTKEKRAMEVLIDLIPLIKLFAVFTIVVVLQKKVMSIGPAFLAGAVILQLWFPVPLKTFFSEAVNSALSIQTISLAFILVLIVSLSHSLKITGHFDRIVSSLKQYVASPRKTVFLLPALIGLLPMPGGAIFSAPMVGEITRGMKMSPSRRAAVNHWFRHVWEYTWPLYPGILLTARITGIGLLLFIGANIPFTVIAVAAGFLWIARSKHVTADEEPRKEGRSPGELLYALAPIGLVIVMFLFLHLFCATAAQIISRSVYSSVSTLPGNSLTELSLPSWTANCVLIPSIIAAIAFTVIEYPQISLRDVFKDKRIPSLIAMIFGLLLFQDILRTGPAVVQILEIFAKWSIPIWILAVLLPFITGLVTGITVGFVACSFPIIAETVIHTGNTHYMHPLILLAFVCGFMGVIISPLHVCLLLTAKHFNASLTAVIVHLVPPAATMLAAAAAMFLLLRYLF